VTGAGTGIGRGIALEFARQGAAVAVHYSRSSTGAEATVKEIVAAGGKAGAFKADFSQVAPLQAMAGEAVKFLGGLDVLVNSAGITMNRPMGHSRGGGHRPRLVRADAGRKAISYQSCCPCTQRRLCHWAQGWSLAAKAEGAQPTPQGFLNQVIRWIDMLPFVHIPSQTWLQDPRLAMVCCVIPTVWASMGMASLIYLAALKGVPEEIYEAADVDGAGVFTKLRKITLPTLMPLIVINFVGAFIGTFQNMGNIFLLTFGGPGETTMVLGLRIWIEAYNNLRFSMATSMAWVMGSLLIGFTFLQIKLLQRVEFKKAEWN